MRPYLLPRQAAQDGSKDFLLEEPAVLGLLEEAREELDLDHGLKVEAHQEEQDHGLRIAKVDLGHGIALVLVAAVRVRGIKVASAQQVHGIKLGLG